MIKNFDNLISGSYFLFGEACPLIDPRTSTQAGGTFFYSLQGGGGLLVPVEKWVSHEYLCILGNFLEQRTYLHFTFMKNIPAEMLLVHELDLDTPCLRLRTLLTMVIRWRDGCFGRAGCECTFAEFCLALLTSKYYKSHVRFEFRRRLENVTSFYVKEFFNPWHNITLNVLLI
jgi:hypothetical protein